MIERPVARLPPQLRPSAEPEATTRNPGGSDLQKVTTRQTVTKTASSTVNPNISDLRAFRNKPFSIQYRSDKSHISIQVDSVAEN